MTCLDDRRLFDVHFGDGSPAERRHAAICDACGTRLRALRRDVGRIDAVCESMPPRLVDRPSAGWRWAPLAVAALAMLIVVTHRAATTPDESDDTLVLADEFSTAVTSPLDLVDESAADAAASSTCPWGDSLLGVGCDAPPVTQIAWR